MLNTAFNKTNPIPVPPPYRCRLAGIHSPHCENEPNYFTTSPLLFSSSPLLHFSTSPLLHLPSPILRNEPNPRTAPIVIPSAGLRSEAQRPKAEGPVQSASPEAKQSRNPEGSLPAAAGPEADLWTGDSSQTNQTRTVNDCRRHVFRVG